jgi:predicted ATPase
VLCLARPGSVEEREWPAEILRLQPLADEETSALIETLIGGARLEDEARSRVLEAAAGIPLFVEELLALLVEEGLVREGQDGEWVATRSLAEFTIPPSIDALLAERLDRLGARERVLLEDGAVEGQLFHVGALLALAAEVLERAVALLADLVERELVQPASASFADETAYRFRHILIRDAAYRALPKKARAELHERYALWLETKVGERMTGYEEILGYHFEQAYRYRAELGLRGAAHAERGGRLLAAAGHRALARSDMAAAEGLLSRAAELLPREDPERVELLLGLSVALRDLAAFDRAAAVNREAMELAAATGLRGVEARGRMNGAFLRLYTDPARSHELVAAAEEALPVCEELGDDLGLAQALWFIGVAEWNRGRAGRARELAERALRHAEYADDRHMRDQALSLVAISVLFGPTPVEQALERCRSLHEGARSARGTAAVMMSYTAVLEAMRGRFDVAREQAARSVAMLEDVGRRMTAAGARYFAARVELLADEPGRAEEVARAGLVTLDAAGETANSPVLRALLAEALCREGRFAEAEAQAEASEQKAWPDDIRAQVLARAARAQALAAQGHGDRGEELAREALARLEHAEDIDLRAATLVALAATLSGTERDDARRSALELYERKGNLAAAARVRESLVAS